MTTITTLPLESFRKAMGYNPWHFWGFAGRGAEVTSACNQVMREYSWQSEDSAGRDNVRQAILSAEGKLATLLGYRTGSGFVTDTVPYPPLSDTRMTRLTTANPRGRITQIRCSEGHIRSLGVETRLLLGINLAVVYSDRDGDGLNETFTVTLPTTYVNPSEVVVTLSAADRLEGDPMERWRIAPVTVSQSAGVMTITGRSWLLGVPLLWETGRNLDPNLPASFVGTLDVHRVYANPNGTTTDQSQAVFLWDTDPESLGLCESCNGVDPTQQTQQIARGRIVNQPAGMVALSPASYNASGWCQSSFLLGVQPDSVTVRYQGGVGYKDTGDVVGSPWDIQVARFAAAELSQRLCACDMANRELYRWQYDLSTTQSASEEEYQVSERDLVNPLGTRAGAVDAWKRASHSARPVVLIW